MISLLAGFRKLLIRFSQNSVEMWHVMMAYVQTIPDLIDHISAVGDQEGTLTPTVNGPWSWDLITLYNKTAVSVGDAKYIITSCARGDTICPVPLPPPWAPSASRAVEQTQRTSSFPRPIRSHGHRCTCLTR